MSDGENRENRHTAENPWPYGQRALRISPLSPLRVLETVSDARDQVRRTLETSYSDDSAPVSPSRSSSPVHVQIEREISFGELDESLLRRSASDSRINNRLRPQVEFPRTVSSDSDRREFALISYASSLFEEYHTPSTNMMRSPTRSPRGDTNAEVNREGARMGNDFSRTNASGYPDADDTVIHVPAAGPSGRSTVHAGSIENNPVLLELLQSHRAMQAELNNLRQSRAPLIDWRDNSEQARDATNQPTDVTYGRTLNDVRSRPPQPREYMKLKEARASIPYFDGTSPQKLQEFLLACTYAAESIHPADEREFVRAILYTKLRGKALAELHTKNIESFEQLKREVEINYQGTRSLTHVHSDFHALRLRTGEGARNFGTRVDKLALELYEVMIEGEDFCEKQRQAILRVIQKLALESFILGLPENINVVLRAQRHANLKTAIDGACEEEKTRKIPFSATRPKVEFANPQRGYKTVTCQKCGKAGHIGRDCRTSRYADRFALPKPSRPTQVNAVEKYCDHCKRAGHTREECWMLHGRPEGRPSSQAGKIRAQPSGRSITYKGQRPTHINTARNSEDEDREKDKRTVPAIEYRVTKVSGRPQGNTGLDLVTMPIAEVKQGKIRFLCDTGATVTLLKLKSLKDDTLIYEDRMALTGVTGHKMYTIGKIKATIKLPDQTISHPIYIVKDDFPIDYEGILGVDFLQKQGAVCDFQTKQIQLGNTILRLYPYELVELQPRSETIIQASTNINQVGIARAEEIEPGVFIGNCLVQPKGFTCPITIINTTDTRKEIQVPYVTLEEIAEDDTAKVCVTQMETPRAETVTLPRSERIKDKLRTQHLNAEEKKALASISDEYSDVFHLEGEPLTCTDRMQHEIATRSDSAPVNVRPYRLPEKHKEEVNRQVREMLQNEIIRPSVSQWNAPLLVVPKKMDASGKPKLRIVVDFRKVNDLTIGDSFPLPNITDILDQLGNAKYFSTLDLASGYHQIPMKENDKCKTAFSTPYGHYEYNRMPFGLKNAPATFQRLMNSILTGIQGIKCLVYLDDIVIYGPSLEEHNKRLREVLRRLRQSHLKLQPDKCEFLRKEVTYLGHIIAEDGIKPDPSKLTAVREFPPPTKVKDIQAFIGLAGYYRKFIDNFSKIAKPLTTLTKKGEKFIWTTEQQNAFETLKNKLITAPILKYPDFEQEFLVTTDASDYAIGAVLSQGKVGQDRPIAYASRILSRAERNYSTTEKELLAIVWAVKHFRPYLYGTKFKIITDHKPLIWLFSVTDPGSRLIRWRLKLEEYDYEIIHKAGKANANADALSRNVPEKICTLAENEEETMHNNEKYDEEDKRRILYEYHDAPIGGHQGAKRTINRIRLLHNWSGLTKDVENYIAKCEYCQKNKLCRKTKAPMVITDTPDKALEKCALDIVGPLTITNNGNKYILTFQDSLTKYSKAIPIPNQEASTVAKEFVTKIILEHGIPEKILTDQGTNFLSEVFKNVCKLLGIEKLQTTAYHPESNGALERSHRTLAEYLRHYINADQTDWDEWLPYAMFTYNTTPHTATNFTPFELIFGKQANLPTALSKPPRPTYTYDNYAHELREKLRASQQVAKENLKVEKAKAKENYDKKTKQVTFKEGDKVLVHDETVRRGRSKKLDSLWTGPYTIIEKHSDVNYTIKIGRRKVKTHANRLKAAIEN